MSKKKVFFDVTEQIDFVAEKILLKKKILEELNIKTFTSNCI